MEQASLQHMRRMQAKLLEQSIAQTRLQEEFNALNAQNEKLEQQLQQRASALSSVSTFAEKISNLETEIAIAKLAFSVPVSNGVATVGNSGFRFGLGATKQIIQTLAKWAWPVAPDTATCMSGASSKGRTAEGAVEFARRVKYCLNVAKTNNPDVAEPAL